MRAKILVVDDEPSLLRLTGYSLEIEGYEVLTAQTAGEALAKVRSEHPDLIVLDVMLPDMSGLDACRQLRADAETADLPIIMLSARAQVTDRVRGLKAGADEYMTKPFDSEELITRIETLLERTRRFRRVPPPPQGRVIGFIGAKGGVGTTTVALQVALSLAAAKKRTIAIEWASYGGTFSSQLTLTPTDTLADLVDRDPTHITEQDLTSRLVAHPSGLRMLFGAQKATDYRDIKPDAAEAIMRGAAALADHLIADVRCYPSPASRAIVRCCDSVVIVLEPDPICVTSAHALSELLGSWGVRADALGIVIVNRAGLFVPTLLNDVVPDIRSRLGLPVLGIIPPALDLCLSALKVDTRQTTTHGERAFATSLTELAARLSGNQHSAPVSLPIAAGS